jgi:hypothetical protein
MFSCLVCLFICLSCLCVCVCVCACVCVCECICVCVCVHAVSAPVIHFFVPNMVYLCGKNDGGGGGGICVDVGVLACCQITIASQSTTYASQTHSNAPQCDIASKRQLR